MKKNQLLFFCLILTISFCLYSEDDFHSPSENTKNRKQIAPATSAPTVVIVSYGRKDRKVEKTEVAHNPWGDKNIETKKIVTETDRVVANDTPYKILKDCGINVAYLDDIEPDKLTSTIQKLNLPKESYILLNSHGDNDQGKFIVGSDNSPLKFLDGNKVVTELAKMKLPVWLGTCRADLCGITGCIGAECGKREVSHTNLFAFHQLQYSQLH
jgi:hypothetical protein